ncbi:MAG: efflux RND transporter permease subunit [Acidobacteria bacterium]|nr:efflux RND transporter permease subunit [Acidobacteriota bacterium]
MWIVRLALRRPYTFTVMALLMTLLGALSIYVMPTDIFPTIDIPVVSVIWAYNGLSPEEMATRVLTSSERAITTTVNDIERIEGTAVSGFGVIRVYFHPGTNVDSAVAQLTSVSQAILRIMPPGMFPPFIIRYNAASVPILQLAISSKTMGEMQLFDNAQNFIRTGLATVQGASLPLPSGGKMRTIMVDLDPAALYAKRLSPADISLAINSQNLILPAGQARIGDREYNVKLNGSPEIVAEMNNFPVKVVNGQTVFVRDVAQVRDGFMPQTNIVRQDGTRGALLTVLKSGRASTLDIIERVQAGLTKILATLPPEMEVKRLFDQSLFVRAAIDGVVREGAIAALLTGLMILVFLGSWRSTLIVCVSIPLSILTSLTILNWLGQTINVMTLGGLSLAVGILVDDATVEIENIHRNLHQGKGLFQSIIDGAQQIAVPTFVSTLSICIVFVPVVFLTGTAKYLFTPLAMAVVFAMLASYLLSRTLVPAMVNYLVAGEIHRYQGELGPNQKPDRSPIWLFHCWFDKQFDRLRDVYQRSLDWTLRHAMLCLFAFTLFAGGSFYLARFVGQDFFPEVDAGQFRLHVRAPAGTRIEETEQYFARVERIIRRIVPPPEIDTILDNIGLPYVGINLAYSDSGTNGSSDGEILVALKRGNHGPTREYIQRIRHAVKEELPDVDLFFQPADMVSQILNFGLPAPIDIQIATRNLRAGYQAARDLQREVSRIPGATDVHIHQVMDYPEVKVNLDRVRAGQVGVTARDVASNLLVSLSGSGQVAPNYWLSPVNGVSYQVMVQTPTHRMAELADLENTPVTQQSVSQPQLLRNVSTIDRGVAMGMVSHYNVQPVFDVLANVEHRDLGSVARHVQAAIDRLTPKLPKGMTISMRGQVETMTQSFTRLGLGLIIAIVLVYLLMVVNFQTWLDPLIILTALPGALAGIVWMLFATGSTFNVPSLMGAIMSIGVGVANSILVVTFANERRADGVTARQAALESGATRLRPVVMTALAMVMGMLPMSLGLGEGGEQNAPLGRAVIGGLVLATLATLYVVPVVYSLLSRRLPRMLDEAAPVELKS